jgi:FkbM family methyltransferase
MPAPRKIAFITASTDHGMFIVNRFDGNYVANRGYGVGLELLEHASRDPDEIGLTLGLLDLRRHYYGQGVVAVDCGANIGIHTVEWAKHMTGWGSVLAIEAQERVYYALAGNIAINNCFNARAMNIAVGSQQGTIKIPSLDHLAPASFGSLELKQRERTEAIGQAIDYSGTNRVDVQAASLDSLALNRVDLIKIDVEGMEFDVLDGAVNCLNNQHPMLFIEWIKSDKAKLKSRLEAAGYAVNESGMNFLAVHRSDKAIGHIKAQS